MAVLQSQNQDIYVLSGQTLVEQFDCFQDDTLSIPFDLTDYALQAFLEIPSLGGGDPIVLTAGDGLVVDAPNGIIQLNASTTGWMVGRGRWYVEATDGSAVKSYPLRGVLYVGAP